MFYWLNSFLSSFHMSFTWMAAMFISYINSFIYSRNYFGYHIQLGFVSNSHTACFTSSFLYETVQVCCLYLRLPFGYSRLAFCVYSLRKPAPT
ncbi:hypothetical protein BDZ91DRAFT_177391 [Kalaharituber pfeilii]|nr:hypothetical protein BDZ91DRAFT_177391 [Kalaharituber pfeilii]